MSRVPRTPPRSRLARAPARTGLRPAWIVGVVLALALGVPGALAAPSAPSLSPAVPPNPYGIYGYVNALAGGPASGAAVFVNDTAAGIALVTTTNSAGQYQVDLAETSHPYSNGDNVTVHAQGGGDEATNWTHINTALAGSWVNLTLAVPPLTISLASTPSTLYSGSPVTLEAAVAHGGATSHFTWSFGDGSAPASSAANTTTHTYAAGGRFQANVTVASGGQVAGASVNLTVLPAPTLGLSLRPTASWAGANVTLSAALAPAQAGTWEYLFTYGDGSAPSGWVSTTSVVHEYTSAGNFSVNASARLASTGYQVSSTVLTLPVARGLKDSLALESSAAEAGLTTTFEAGSWGSASSVSYTFAFGDGGSVGPQADASASHTYAAAGPYTASVLATNTSGARSSASLAVTVAAHLSVTLAAASTSGPTPFAASWTASPSGGVGTVTYEFSLQGAAFQSASGPSYATTLTVSGSYTLEVLATDALGAVAFANSTVTAQPSTSGAFTVDLTGPTGGVVNDTLSFNVTISGGLPPYTEAWRFGDGGTASATRAPSHVYAAQGTFLVTVFVNDSAGDHLQKETNVTITGPTSTPIATSATDTGTELLVLGIVLVAVAAVAIVLLLRRRRARTAPPPSPGAAPAPPPSPPGAGPEMPPPPPPPPA